MPSYPIYQVDAFTDRAFSGNPAAIIPLQAWFSDDLMLQIAAENNLSETAFFVPSERGYHLRWFTPTNEVPLCGHATLAAAHVLYDQLGYDQDTLIFETQSGDLIVSRTETGYSLDFPQSPPTPCAVPEDLSDAFGGVKLLEAHENRFCLVVAENADAVINAVPDHSALAKIAPYDFILTAKGDGSPYDFVSRCFAPAHGIPEDPVTGSAHCVAAPFWAERLGKTTLLARQASPRGGDLTCILQANDRIALQGQAVLILKGEIFLP